MISNLNSYIHLQQPFIITLVDLSFFVGAGKDLTKICSVITGVLEAQGFCD